MPRVRPADPRVSPVRHRPRHAGSPLARSFTDSTSRLVGPVACGLHRGRSLGRSDSAGRHRPCTSQLRSPRVRACPRSGRPSPDPSVDRGGPHRHRGFRHHAACRSGGLGSREPRSKGGCGRVCTRPRCAVRPRRPDSIPDSSHRIGVRDTPDRRTGLRRYRSGRFVAPNRVSERDVCPCRTGTSRLEASRVLRSDRTSDVRRMAGRDDRSRSRRSGGCSLGRRRLAHSLADRRGGHHPRRRLSRGERDLGAHTMATTGTSTRCAHRPSARGHCDGCQHGRPGHRGGRSLTDSESSPRRLVASELV
jgi:hypothetical protein